MPSAIETSSLPVIDISPFLSQSSDASSLAAARAQVGKQVHEACLRFGFFYINGLESVVSKQDMDDILATARAFFALPEEKKAQLAIQPGDGARGWQKLGLNVTQYKADHHEGYDLYRPVEQEDPTRLLHGPNRWPSEPASFRPAMETWIEKMQVIGRALMQATALGLGIDLESDEWEKELKVNDSFWVMRCIGYPPLPENAPGVSCGAHKDYGCYTLLHADSTPGALQVFLPSTDGPDLTTDGVRGTWLTANPIEGAFVVNIGHMWETWTNELYQATLHRVIHKGDNYRVSIPFFYEPAFDAVVKPLPSALKLQKEIGNEPLKKRQAVVYGDFLTSKVSGNFAEVK